MCFSVALRFPDVIGLLEPHHVLVPNGFYWPYFYPPYVSPHEALILYDFQFFIPPLFCGRISFAEKVS